MRRMTVKFFSLAVAVAIAVGCGVKVNDEGDPPGKSSIHVTSISPVNGPINGGTQVTIEGSGFDDGTGTIGVWFGGYYGEVAGFDDTSIVVYTPPGDDFGAVEVGVENAFGQQVLPDAFEYGNFVYGAVTILSAFDIVNPNQFNPAVNDYMDAYMAFTQPTENELTVPIPPANSCEFNPPDQPFGSVVLLDAGNNVTLSGPGSDVLLPRQTGPRYYPTNVIPGTSAFFQDATYTVSNDGGPDIPAMGEIDALVTPTDFVVAAPNIGAVPLQTVSRGIDLTFQWSGGSPGLFYIELAGYLQGTGYTNEKLRCRADDSGSFTIAGGYMNMFTQSDQLVVTVARRTDAYWVVPTNSALGQSVGIINKIGVLAYPF